MLSNYPSTIGVRLRSCYQVSLGRTKCMQASRVAWERFPEGVSGISAENSGCNKSPAMNSFMTGVWGQPIVPSSC